MLRNFKPLKWLAVKRLSLLFWLQADGRLKRATKIRLVKRSKVAFIILSIFCGAENKKRKGKMWWTGRAVEKKYGTLAGLGVLERPQAVYGPFLEEE
jgi:hypothetical protein